MIPLKILSTGVAVPAGRVTSAELDARLGFPNGYVQRRSGVVHRYHADSRESQSELGAKALHAALARAVLYSAWGVIRFEPGSACRSTIRVSYTERYGLWVPFQSDVFSVCTAPHT